MRKVFYTNSAEETKQLGEQLAKHALPNMVFLMEADLGSGKTTMTQGIAKELGITKPVTSPTFNIMKIYQGTMPLYHIDAYRLEGISQDLGLEEYMEDDGLTVMEWSEFLPDLIPEEYLKINILIQEEDQREITLEAHGKQYETLLEELG